MMSVHGESMTVLSEDESWHLLASMALDLGKSGGSSDERHGFQRLIAEIGLGHAGLIVSLDGSRLARNNADWHRLLELCGLFGTLLADAERLYDPQATTTGFCSGCPGL